MKWSSGQISHLMSLINDTTQRPFLWVIEGGYNVALAPAFYLTSKLEIFAQGADPKQESLDHETTNLSSTPPPMSLSYTAQWSVAHADAEIRLHAGSAQYSVPA